MATERHWRPADSSRFDALDYDAATQTLFVKFHADKQGNQSVYSYANIPPVVFEEMLQAKSRGRYFSKIKDNPEDFPYKKVGTEPAVKETAR